MENHHAIAVIGKASISIRAIYTMAMLNNQRVSFGVSRSLKSWESYVWFIFSTDVRVCLTVAQIFIDGHFALGQDHPFEFPKI